MRRYPAGRIAIADQRATDRRHHRLTDTVGVDASSGNDGRPGAHCHSHVVADSNSITNTDTDRYSPPDADAAPE